MVVVRSEGNSQVAGGWWCFSAPGSEGDDPTLNRRCGCEVDHPSKPVLFPDRGVLIIVLWMPAIGRETLSRPCANSSQPHNRSRGGHVKVIVNSFRTAVAAGDESWVGCRCRHTHPHRLQRLGEYQDWGILEKKAAIETRFLLAVAFSCQCGWGRKMISSRWSRVRLKHSRLRQELCFFLTLSATSAADTATTVINRPCPRTFSRMPCWWRSQCAGNTVILLAPPKIVILTLG